MLRVRREGEVLVWTIARPAVRNALDAATVGALEAAADEAEADPSARAVVLEGEGDAFCAGGDLNEVRTLTEAEPTGAFSDLGHHVLGRLEALRIPVIAAVRGAALGGGAELALVGRGGALHALLTARDLSGVESVRVGLAEVLADDARDGALELARDIGRCAPSSVAAFKQLVRAGGARDVERRLFVEMWTGPEHVEAVRAHFERRVPAWAEDRGGQGNRGSGGQGSGNRGST